MTTAIHYYSLREFAEQKGMPTKTGEHVICEPMFEYEMSVPGIYFGNQFVSFSHQIIKKHKEQNYNQIATDILRNASKYKIHQLIGYTTREGGPVYSICPMMTNDKQSQEEQAKKIIIQNTPYYLFFDTETTGVPKDDSAPASNTKKWPRLVQLAWILTDKEGNTLSSSCNIIKPEGFTIPDDAAKIHGINTYKAMREGKLLRSVISDFLKAAEKARWLVGHNVAFDQKVVGAELFRLGITDTISTVKAVCTMAVSKDFCEIPGGYYGFKPPKLQELHQKLFGTTFDNAHDAMADVKATKKCFFELKRLDIPELIFFLGLALLS